MTKYIKKNDFNKEIESRFSTQKKIYQKEKKEVSRIQSLQKIITWILMTFLVLGMFITIYFSVFTVN